MWSLLLEHGAQVCFWKFSFMSQIDTKNTQFKWVDDMSRKNIPCFGRSKTANPQVKMEKICPIGLNQIFNLFEIVEAAATMGEIWLHYYTSNTKLQSMLSIATGVSAFKKKKQFLRP